MPAWQTLGMLLFPPPPPLPLPRKSWNGQNAQGRCRSSSNPIFPLISQQNIPGAASGNEIKTRSAPLRSCLSFMFPLQETGAVFNPSKSRENWEKEQIHWQGWGLMASNPEFCSSCCPGPILIFQPLEISLPCPVGITQPQKIQDQPAWNYPGGSRGFNEAQSGSERGLWWGSEDLGVLEMEGAGMGFWEAPKPQEQLLEAPNSQDHPKEGILVVEIRTFPLARRSFHTGVGELENRECFCVYSQISGFGFTGTGKKVNPWRSTLGSRKMGILAPKGVPRARSRHRGISSSLPSLLPAV